jgi:hypothetical protein
LFDRDSYPAYTPARKPRTYLRFARRLDYFGEGQWENWTSYDFAVGEYDPYGQVTRPKPFASTRERNAVEDAIDAGKATVVETPEQTPEAAWGSTTQGFNQVIRIDETDEAGGIESYYYLVSVGTSYTSWSGGWTGKGTSSTVQPQDDPTGYVCPLCGKGYAFCVCDDDDLLNEGICPICDEDPKGEHCLCGWYLRRDGSWGQVDDDPRDEDDEPRDGFDLWDRVVRALNRDER